jgi:hypothetical protein
LAAPSLSGADTQSDVGGIKFPFEIRTTDWESATVQKFSDIKVNAAVEAARFSKPSR